MPGAVVLDVLAFCEPHIWRILANRDWSPTKHLGCKTIHHSLQYHLKFLHLSWSLKCLRTCSVRTTESKLLRTVVARYPQVIVFTCVYTITLWLAWLPSLMAQLSPHPFTLEANIQGVYGQHNRTCLKHSPAENCRKL